MSAATDAAPHERVRVQACACKQLTVRVSCASRAQAAAATEAQKEHEVQMAAQRAAAEAQKQRSDETADAEYAPPNCDSNLEACPRNHHVREARWLFGHGGTHRQTAVRTSKCPRSHFVCEGDAASVCA
jgi:hypothetical protein